MARADMTAHVKTSSATMTSAINHVAALTRATARATGSVTNMSTPTCTNEEGHEADAMQVDYEHENCLRIRCMHCHAYVIVTIGDDQWLTPEPEWSAARDK